MSFVVAIQSYMKGTAQEKLFYQRRTPRMYNEKTSAMYTDLSLITADQEIGKEASEVFAALLKGETLEHTGNLLSDPGGKRLY